MRQTSSIQIDSGTIKFHRYSERTANTARLFASDITITINAIINFVALEIESREVLLQII